MVACGPTGVFPVGPLGCGGGLGGPPYVADGAEPVWGACARGGEDLPVHVCYRYAPVVVAANPRFSWQGGPEHLKYTIGRWNTSTLPWMDWQGMQDQLNAEDPAVTARARWSGSSSIIGSPQGVSSGLPLERVVEIVEEGAR